MKTIPKAASSPRRFIAITTTLVLLLVGSTPIIAGQPSPVAAKSSERAFVDPLPGFLSSPGLAEALENESLPLLKTLDRVHSFSYHFPIDRRKTISVTEYFTLRSVLRRPARAALFLTGPEFRGNFWTIPVEGYNGPEMVAKKGFFAYTFDYVGVGDSYRPEDGSKVNYLTQVPAVRKLVDFIRRSRRVARVDLVGEGYGAEIAAQLADEPQRIRSVAMSVITYKTLSQEILPFYSPELEAFLRGQPDGYWQVPFLDLTLQHSTNEALREYVFQTQGDQFFPTGPALQYWDFGYPIIDAEAATVPGLIIAGELDPFPAAGDMDELAQDWGGGAKLVVILGAYHVPRIESEEVVAQYYQALFAFLESSN